MRWSDDSPDQQNLFAVVKNTNSPKKSSISDKSYKYISSDSDSDSDNEDNSGGGDGNNDGIPDSQQKNVVSFPNTLLTGNPYMTLEITGSPSNPNISNFYNTNKILGFRLAPFAFGEFSLLKPVKLGFGKSDVFSAVGGGIRTRNENLVFGTIELKGYFFPRTNGDMKPWKVELNSNIRFKYKSSFISRPDFIIAN